MADGEAMIKCPILPNRDFECYRIKALIFWGAGEAEAE
jgi:hypothetical protein